MLTARLGGWTLRTLDAGFVWLDGGAMFGSVPKPLWSRLIPPDERNRIRLSLRCLLLEGHGRRVLVDDGIGDKSPPRFADIYGVDSAGPALERPLAALGLRPEDVTDVLLTHLHFDHAGGSTRRVGGQLVPAFPAARFHVQARNLANARDPNPRERASYLVENFEPLVRAGVLDTWDGALAPWPGIELLRFDGHTIGQQAVRIAGPEGVVYYVADLVPMAPHVRVPYVMGYDVSALVAMGEKRALLARAAAERAWIVLEHDPAVVAARPRVDGDDFDWEERLGPEAVTLPGPGH